MSALKKNGEVSDSSSDNDSDSSEDERDHFEPEGPSTSREKRNVSWCGVEDTKSSTPIFQLRRVVWPPPSTSLTPLRNAYVDPRNLRWGNPNLSSKMQLYCKTGYFLGVYPDGKVRGTRDEADLHTFLEMMTGGLLPEHVKIRGMLTNMYVAMDKKGRLYAENMDGAGTPFGEKIQLYCERGFLLRISEDGEISGTQDSCDSYTQLMLQSANDIGLVKIKGLDSGLYACFSENGNLLGEGDADLPGTTFRENFHGSYNCYECVDYQGWFLGINKRGDIKNGKRTQPAKKSTKFLPIRIK